MLVHQAFWQSPQRPGPYYFIVVTNLSRQREVEVTHVWFETTPRLDVLNPDRPLPKRLKLDEQWATWIPVSQVPLTEPLSELSGSCFLHPVVL